MTWTNEWLGENEHNIQNKEFLFLIQKKKVHKSLIDFNIQKVNLRETVWVDQQKLPFS